MARVPTLAIWDDHDICDGWGSLYRSKTYSEVGQCLYRVAREMYLLFQHAAIEADIPDLFLDKTGTSLSWQRALPGVTLLAPDLRGYGFSDAPKDADRVEPEAPVGHRQAAQPV